MALSLTLFGGFTLRDSDGTVLSLPTRKVSGLLAYLAVNAGRPQSRDRLTALFWGERGERQARQSLNHALRAIRKLHTSAGSPLLKTEGEQVTLPGDAIDIDIVRFQALLTDQPAEAAALYKGPFLDGLAISESEFENWLAMTRADFHDRACDAFERAAMRAAEDGDLPSATMAARSLMQLDPVRESGHQLLMRLHYLAGDRASALRQYQACTEALKRELDVTPGSTTRRLHEAILRDAPVERKPEAPIPAPCPEGLAAPAFAAPTAPKTSRHTLRTGLIWATMLVGINVVPWQIDGTALVDPAKHLHSAIAGSSQGMVASVERKTFGSSVERDAWYAGARQTVEQIYDRRLKSLIASWNLRDCDAASSLSTDVLCRDIAYRIQRLERQRTAELDAVRRMRAHALVSPSTHSRSESTVASETVKRPTLVKGPSNNAPSPNVARAQETQTPDEADRARTASKATGTKPVAVKPAPPSTPIAGEVRRDYAERPGGYPQKTNVARRVPHLSKSRWQTASLQDSEQETVSSVRSIEKMHVDVRAKPVLAPIPKRKPASPASRIADQPSAATTMTDAVKPEKAERRDKGTISRAVSETEPARVDITEAKMSASSYSNAEFEKDREAIASAISDFYDVTGYTKDFPTSTNGAWLNEITSMTLYKGSRNSIQVDARYLAIGIYENTNRSLEGRFTLAKTNGTYRVVASSSLHRQAPAAADLKTALDEDREKIAQAISDYYDITGYSKDFPTSTNGAWLDEIISMSLRHSSEHRIQVDAEYVAVSIYSNAELSSQGRFTLEKSNGTYRVLGSSSPDKLLAKPSRMKLNFGEAPENLAQTFDENYL